jgi:hypothetical protein
MRSVRVVLTVLALLVAGLAVLDSTTASATSSRSNTASPSVKVFPSRGLSGGRTVLVAGAGLPKRTEIAVIQCEHLQTNRSDEGCGSTKTVTSNRWGRVLTRVLLRDPVVYSGPVGPGFPMYCRADDCRIILAWGDPDLGEQEGVESKQLVFKGSPATIAVRPSTNLRRQQWVTVTGTAFGAEGQRVGVRQHICSRHADAFCYGDLEYRWSIVKRDGTFRLHYLVRRFVPTSAGGPNPDPFFDCNISVTAPELGSCSVVARILDRKGQPDDSFGSAEHFGDPAAPLEFATG